MYNVQCTIFNVQCSMYNVQCSMYNIQCTICNWVAFLSQESGIMMHSGFPQRIQKCIRIGLTYYWTWNNTELSSCNRIGMVTELKRKMQSTGHSVDFILLCFFWIVKYDYLAKNRYFKKQTAMENLLFFVEKSKKSFIELIQIYTKGLVRVDIGKKVFYNNNIIFFYSKWI